MPERLNWAIELQGDVTVIKLKGSVDEDADFALLAKDLGDTKKIRINEIVYRKKFHM